MSDTLSYAPSTQALARPPLSKAALASLILGILLCIPLLTSIAALVCAILGIRATRASAGRRGRGLAIAGLTLGIVGTVGWGAVGCLSLFIITGSAAPRAVLHDFAHHLASGNIPAAAAECDASILPSQLATLRTKIVPFGSYIDLTCTNVYLGVESTGRDCKVAGVMSFSSGSHRFNAVLIQDVAGKWKIQGFHVY